MSQLQIDLARIYGGDIVTLPARAESLALCAQVQAALDAEQARGEGTPFEQVSRVRHRLTHERGFGEQVRRVLASAGLSLGRTASDWPRLRAVVSGGHRIAAARPAYFVHRDTWYANPRAQLNWWMPLHDVSEETAVAFFPRWFGVPVPNDSAVFDYERWREEVGWQSSGKALAADRYPSVRDDVALGPPTRFPVRKGELLVFSAAQLHATWPHDTGGSRYSVDFRSVDREDLAVGRGAADPDNRSVGLSIRDYFQP